MNFASLILLLFCLSSAATKAQELTQTIRGRVVDKELQTPLPGATIILVGSDPLVGTTTAADGTFRLEKIPVGRRSIIVRFMGYNDAQLSSLLLTSGKEIVLEIELQEKIFEAEAIEIVSSNDRKDANNEQVVSSVTTLKAEEINRFAGSRADPSRMASNYAGVVSGGDQRNDIIVRGNTPSGILWRLEGVDIPSPNHFSFTGNSGGAVSILNNNLLANSDFISGAFPAEYGNKLSAVFDVKLRNGNNEKHEHTLQAGLAGLEAMTEGPIDRKRGGSYILSYRFFTFEILHKMGVSIGYQGMPTFQDLNFKINLPSGKAGSFSLWALAGKSNIYVDDSSLDTNKWYANPVYDTDFHSDMFASGLSYGHLLGKKLAGKFSASVSGSHYYAEIDRVFKDGSRQPDERYDNSDMQYLAQYNLTYKINPRNLIKSGVTYRIMAYKNLNTFFNTSHGQPLDALNEKGETGLSQAFTHWQFYLTEKLQTHTGLLFQHFQLNDTWTLEPRFALSYDPNTKQRIHFAYGLHSQSHQLVYYTYRFFDPVANTYRQPNRNLDFTKAHHLVLGYRHFLSPVLELKTDIYYQHLFNVPVSAKQGMEWYSMLNVGADYSIMAADSMVNEGTGNNFGTELTLQRHFRNGYYFLTTLSLFQSRYSGYDGRERPTAFDVGYVSNVLAGREIALDDNNRTLLSADMRVTYTGGKRYIPIDEEKSKLKGGVVYDLEEAYQPKVKDYFRTDIKITLNLNRTKASHNFYIAADNLFNTKNELTRYWESASQTVRTEYQLGLFPYAGYRINF